MQRAHTPVQRDIGDPNQDVLFVVARTACRTASRTESATVGSTLFRLGLSNRCRMTAILQGSLSEMTRNLLRSRGAGCPDMLILTVRILDTPACRNDGTRCGRQMPTGSRNVEANSHSTPVLSHQWRYLNQLDSIRPVKELVSFDVDQHNA